MLCNKASHDIKYLAVRNKKELYDIILPFFIKYNINNGKHKDLSIALLHSTLCQLQYCMLCNKAII